MLVDTYCLVLLHPRIRAFVLFCIGIDLPDPTHCSLAPCQLYETTWREAWTPAGRVLLAFRLVPWPTRMTRG